MTIDEAIEYLREENANDENEQIAEWLEELKELRELRETYKKGMETSYATFKYNQAIDDVIKYFDNLINKGIWNTSPFIVKEWLEQLKGENDY